MPDADDHHGHRRGEDGLCEGQLLEAQHHGRVYVGGDGIGQGDMPPPPEVDKVQ